MGAERWDEQVGSVADEAARLLESLRRTAADAAASGPEADRPQADRPPADRPRAAEPGTAADPGPGEEHAGAAPGGHDRGCSDPVCQWCPLCRTSALVRALSPETLTRLADLAGLAAAVLGDLASARTAAAGRPAAPAPSGRGDGDTGRARPIPVHAADDPQEDPHG